LFVLDNSDGAFFPDAGGTYAASLKKGLLVRFTMTYSTSQQLWKGWIEDWTFDIDPNGQKIVTVTATDKSYEMQEAEYIPTLATDVLVSTEINNVLTSGLIALPYTVSTVGGAIYDYSVYDSAYYMDAAPYIDLETSAETLDYTGDVPEGMLKPLEPLNAQQYIAQLCLAEMDGVFYWDGRVGQYRFLDRRYEINNPTVRGTFTGAGIVDAGQPAYGDDVINRMTVGYALRKEGTAASTLYAIDSPITLRGGEERMFSAQYRDPAVPTARCSGMDMLTPVSGTDYVAYQFSDGSGTNQTTKLLVNVQFGSQSAKVTLRNLEMAAAIYVTTLQLRGTPLTTYERQTVTKSDPTSIAAHGYRRYTHELSLIGNARRPAEYAQVTVNQRKDAILRIPYLSFNAHENATLAGYARDIDVGDRIYVDLSLKPVGSAKYYTVLGQQYRYNAGIDQMSRTLVTTYILKPVKRLTGAFYDDATAVYDGADVTYVF
jgi:hypothetical protein